jgi:hypothetical protein
MPPPGHTELRERRLLPLDQISLKNSIGSRRVGGFDYPGVRSVEISLPSDQPARLAIATAPTILATQAGAELPIALSSPLGSGTWPWPSLASVAARTPSATCRSGRVSSLGTPRYRADVAVPSRVVDWTCWMLVYPLLVLVLAIAYPDPQRAGGFEAVRSRRLEHLA